MPNNYKSTIQEEVLRVVQGHLRQLVEDPSRLELVLHPKEGKKWAWWSIDLDGQMLCYIGVGKAKRHALITFTVKTKDEIGAFEGTWRYGTFEENTDSDVQAALAAAASDRLFADGLHKRQREIAGR